MPPIVIVKVNGEALRTIRKLKRLSTRQVAEIARFDRSYIARIELGQRDGLSPEFFDRLVAALDVPRRALLANPDDEAVA